VFLHCRSTINEEEFEGYQAACAPGVKLVAIRVAPERLGLRLYRAGTRPVNARHVLENLASPRLSLGIWLQAETTNV
jgi:hypothetical protein